MARYRRRYSRRRRDFRRRPRRRSRGPARRTRRAGVGLNSRALIGRQTRLQGPGAATTVKVVVPANHPTQAGSHHRYQVHVNGVGPTGSEAAYLDSERLVMSFIESDHQPPALSAMKNWFQYSTMYRECRITKMHVQVMYEVDDMAGLDDDTDSAKSLEQMERTANMRAECAKYLNQNLNIVYVPRGPTVDNDRKSHIIQTDLGGVKHVNEDYIRSIPIKMGQSRGLTTPRTAYERRQLRFSADGVAERVVQCPITMPWMSCNDGLTDGMRPIHPDIGCSWLVTRQFDIVDPVGPPPIDQQATFTYCLDYLYEIEFRGLL